MHSIVIKYLLRLAPIVIWGKVCTDQVIWEFAYVEPCTNRLLIYGFENIPSLFSSPIVKLKIGLKNLSFYAFQTATLSIFPWKVYIKFGACIWSSSIFWIRISPCGSSSTTKIKSSQQRSNWQLLIRDYHESYNLIDNLIHEIFLTNKSQI